MTREEYMKQLEQSLQGYSREFSEEILDNYREHFETGLREGRTEEEICEELGEIETLLQDIQEMMGDRDIRAHELEQYTAVVEYQEQYSGIKKVELSLAAIDVKLSASADNQLHVYLEGGQDKGTYLEERMAGDSYYAYERKMERDQSRGLLAQLMNIGRNKENLCLVVEVPEQLESLTIKTISGDMQLGGFGSRELLLSSTSGDIEMEAVRADSLTVQTTSGDMRLDSFGSRELLLSSTSGDIEMETVRADSLSIQTTSGDLTLKAVSAGQLKVKSTSGDLSLREVEAESWESQTVSGDTEGELYAARIRCGSKSGDIGLTLDRRGRKLVVAKSRSVSGDCRICGVDECGESSDPSSKIVAEFSTVSGDITVK